MAPSDTNGAPEEDKPKHPLHHLGYQELFKARSQQGQRRSDITYDMELILTDLERANQRALTAECMDRYQRRKHLNTPTPTHIKQMIQGFQFLVQAQQPDTQAQQPYLVISFVLL